MLSGSCLDWLNCFCKSVRTAVYMSKGTFRGHFLWKKNCQSVLEIERFFFKFFGNFLDGKPQLCSKCPKEQSKEAFTIFGISTKIVQVLSKNFWQGIRSCILCVLMNPLKKVCKKNILSPFRNLRTKISDIWREYSSRNV